MHPGEVVRHKIPDDCDGIRLTIERMIFLIQEGTKDPLVISTARKISSLSTSGRGLKEPKRTTYQLRGIHAWCRAHFEYVMDPVNVELIQTPNRMLRQLAIPTLLHKSMWEPIGKELGGKMPIPKMSGDADETTVLSLSLAGAIGIYPLKICLGGDGDGIHTCWGAAYVGGTWKNFDILASRFNSTPRLNRIDHIEVPIPG